MNSPTISPEERFSKLVETFLNQPAVNQEGKGFGSNALKIRGKIFAMLVRGRLVVKLSKQRVDTLIANGYGEHFDPRKNGRFMKEWLKVDPAFEAEWNSLAQEAITFANSH